MTSSSRPEHPSKIHPSDHPEESEATSRGWKTKKDWKVSCQPTMRRHFGYWRRTMRSLRERCLGGISDSRREKEKENQQAKRAVTNEVASHPFEKVALAGRPIGPTKIRIPTTRHSGEKAKERRERKENRNSNIPMMETKVIHPLTMAKGRTRKRTIQHIHSHSVRSLLKIDIRHTSVRV